MSAAFEGRDEEIGEARFLARAFLTDLREDHGLPVSDRAMGTVELVVSELVTNARKYAPGPFLLTLELTGEAVAVAVWDTEPRLPVILARDPQRVGRHGLEVVTAVCRSFEVHREPVGKRVVATVTWCDDPVGDLAEHQVVRSSSGEVPGEGEAPGSLLGPGRTVGAD
jgi:anti-sigma regulatory factor (Ser/Thr protein kinase)